MTINEQVPGETYKNQSGKTPPENLPEVENAVPEIPARPNQHPTPDFQSHELEDMKNAGGQDQIDAQSNDFDKITIEDQKNQPAEMQY